MMDALQLTFANGESSLSVRSFEVQESLSKPFQIDIVARAPSADIDFEALIGEGANFVLHGGIGGALDTPRKWSGFCVKCELVRVEETGLSTYEVTVVPQLWLLGKRRNHRMFQHQSVVEIVTAMLDEWKVPHRFEVAHERYPALELRVQYGESDYDFLSRMLEEAGISFRFDFDDDLGSVMVLADEPHTAEPRDTVLSFVDSPGQAQALAIDYCTAVHLRRDLKSSKVVLRDFDFRRPRYELFADASGDDGLEGQLEQYHYVPGAFLTEGHDETDTPAADDLGVARADQRAGVSLAKRILQGERSRRRLVSFETNAYDVSPGTTLMIGGHPRAELAATEKLLMTDLQICGDVSSDDPWLAVGKAVFTDTPYRPKVVTQKPRINGVQSAVIVGPEAETVHTDEFGRVRVQFHWDRAGSFDAGSSCWMRVSQAWAGPGYGLFNLPRVGHEVLIGFGEGDPDQPIVVGRVFNGAQQVPYPLPGSKMMSG
jgi:type VI secretion system secreted protein VgrG